MHKVVVENGNGNAKDKIRINLDNSPSFSATIHSSYVVSMAADKQIQAVQEATVLRSRHYTKAGMRSGIPQRSVSSI
jgi:hypothetical protein